MARTVKNAKLDTRSARSRLTARREPYWTVLSPGCAIGYRKGAKGGTWVARLRTDAGKQVYEALGPADDTLDDPGTLALPHSKAQEKAREFFSRKARELAGHSVAGTHPYTVTAALADYLRERERRGSKGVRADRYAAAARIMPLLGDVQVAKLTAARIRDWLEQIEKAPKLVRTGKTAETRRTKMIDAADPDAVRARRATANRVLTVLKAALNWAFHEGKAASDEAWRRVRPYREADAPIVRFLDAAECVRLVNACQGPFRALVRGALVTGCRYGELVRMRVEDFRADSGMVTVRTSKSGKPRHVALNNEGQRIFSALTVGKAGGELIFLRDDGKPWGASHQQRPLAEASDAARISPSPTFHTLRHTYASALAMRAVSMRVIADQLGHSDTRMTERHYARLSPSYVADVVRTALPSMGIADSDERVVPFAAGARS